MTDRFALRRFGSSAAARVGVPVSGADARPISRGRRRRERGPTSSRSCAPTRELRKQRRRVDGPLPVPRRAHAVVLGQPADKVYYCFGCGARGDVIRFRAARPTRLEFTEARRVARRALRRDARARGRVGPRRASAAGGRTGRRASCWPDGRVLRPGAASRARRPRARGRYLAERRLGQDVVDRYELGFGPDESTASSPARCSEGFTEQRAARVGAGAARARGGPIDRFRGRRSSARATGRDRVAASAAGGSRPTRAGPSTEPARRVRSGTRADVLYGLHLARTADREGRQRHRGRGLHRRAGARPGRVENVVASMGTALTQQSCASCGS